MKTVLICTWAYNAEKTIGMAMDSVLNQTHKDFIYYVLDNASTDKTGDVIREYAARDSRVHFLRREVNSLGIETLHMLVKAADQPYAFFAVLDADDEYNPDFLEKAILFSDKHNCDAVCCGSDFIDTKTRRITGKRMFPRDVIIEGNSFDSMLPYYHQFLRTFWGKLIRKSVLDQLDFERGEEIGLRNGCDTHFVLLAFMHATRFGVMAGTDHKYYVYPQSVYRTWQPKRSLSNDVLFDETVAFLKVKCGKVSPRNMEFVLIIYMNALTDTLQTLLGSDLTARDKLGELGKMFLGEHAYMLAAAERFGAQINQEDSTTQQRRKLFFTVTDWLLSVVELPEEEVGHYCELGSFVSAAAENGGAWVRFRKLHANFLLDQGRSDEALAKLNELAELLPDDGEIAEMTKLAQETTPGSGG